MIKNKRKKCCFDGSKLKGRTFNLKINGQVLFTQDEIALLMEILKIPDDEIKPYFFEEKV